MEFKSNTLNQEVTQVYNHLIDADMKVLADEIWAAFLSKDAHKLVNALNHIQQELMNGGASQSPAYQETRKLYLKCKNMLHMHESKTIKKTNKMNIVETVDCPDYLLTDKVYDVCDFLKENGEWELSVKISSCWNPQFGIKNKPELLRTIGEYLKNNWDRRANTVTPIISKLKDLYTTIENEDFDLIMNYNESKEMPSTNNQKYFTPQQAEKMGYSRPEYNMDGSKPYEQWFNAKGQRIYVQRINPLSDLRKNTGKSGFRMHESKTNKNIKKNIVKLNENTLKQIVAESVKKVLNEGYGYDSNPMSGYEEFDRIGESAAYDVMRQLRSKYSNDVDEEAVDRIIDGFKFTLATLVDAGNDDAGVKGFGINYQPY